MDRNRRQKENGLAKFYSRSESAQMRDRLQSMYGVDLPADAMFEDFLKKLDKASLASGNVSPRSQARTTAGMKQFFTPEIRSRAP